jgi:hypothetical protein
VKHKRRAASRKPTRREHLEQQEAIDNRRSARDAADRRSLARAQPIWPICASRGLWPVPLVWWVARPVMSPGAMSGAVAVHWLPFARGGSSAPGMAWSLTLVSALASPDSYGSGTCQTRVVVPSAVAISWPSGVRCPRFSGQGIQ